MSVGGVVIPLEDDGQEHGNQDDQAEAKENGVSGNVRSGEDENRHSELEEEVEEERQTGETNADEEREMQNSFAALHDAIVPFAQEAWVSSVSGSGGQSGFSFNRLSAAIRVL